MSTDDDTKAQLEAAEIEQVQRKAGAKYPGYIAFRCVLALPDVGNYQVGSDDEDLLEVFQTTVQVRREIEPAKKDQYGGWLEPVALLEPHSVAVILLGRRVVNCLERLHRTAMDANYQLTNAEMQLTEAKTKIDALEEEVAALKGQIELGEQNQARSEQQKREALQDSTMRKAAEQAALVRAQELRARLVLIETALGSERVAELTQQGQTEIAQVTHLPALTK